ncbi:hypothetical protein Hanom_Chr11g01025161 [Helianthus anomalus]
MVFDLIELWVDDVGLKVSRKMGAESWMQVGGRLGTPLLLFV